MVFGLHASDEQRPYVGGQAVIEGVMMRSPRSFAVVARRRAGQLVVRERRMPDRRKGVLSWPLVRGGVTLVEALRLGLQALRFSADLYEQDLEAEERAKAEEKASKASQSGMMSTLVLGSALFATVDPGAAPLGSPELESRKRSSLAWVALALVLLVFVALPQAIAVAASRLFHVAVDIRSPGFQLLTGVFKLVIVIGYLLLIRRAPEIYRVFQYHGAEHKAIATYEAGEELTVQNARGKPKLHPRCGTTFLVMVVLVSILVFTAIGPLLPRLSFGGAFLENVNFFLMKLPFLPVIAAITYEFQRLSARFCTTGPLRLILYPGFGLQLITTIEPDDSQIEVALASLCATLGRERSDASAVVDAPPDRTFESFADLIVHTPCTSQPPIELSSGCHAAS